MTFLIGERYRAQLALAMDALGVDVLWLPDDPQIDPRLAGHADLLVFAANGQAFVAEEIYPYIVNNLTYRGYTVHKSKHRGTIYPKDAGLCLCDTGRYLIHNPKTADRAAVAAAKDRRPIPVAQGYAQCAACVVNDDSIITSDAGVSSASKKAGIDVLDITAGYVHLEGFDYGFIGGASFKLNDHTIAFTGTLDKHPDKDRILAFLAAHGQTPIFLTQDPIFDIGGAIALP